MRVIIPADINRIVAEVEFIARDITPVEIEMIVRDSNQDEVVTAMVDAVDLYQAVRFITSGIVAQGE